jgi:hypothetical protein
LATVYVLQENAIFFAATEGIMGTLFILGIASWIGYKTKRFGTALTIGIVLAGLVTINFANVQTTLVLDGDQITVQNLYRGGYRLRKDDVMSLAEFRSRGSGIALVLRTRNGQEYGVVAHVKRRPQLEELLVKELGLTAEPPSGDLKRWSRRS